MARHVLLGAAGPGGRPQRSVGKRLGWTRALSPPSPPLRASFSFGTGRPPPPPRSPQGAGRVRWRRLGRRGLRPRSCWHAPQLSLRPGASRPYPGRERHPELSQGQGGGCRLNLVRPCVGLLLPGSRPRRKGLLVSQP